MKNSNINLINKPMMIDTAQFDALSNVDWIEAENFGLTYNIYNRVAIIPIHGLLTKRTEQFAPIFGTTSYEEIYNAISQAQKDQDVSSILLDIDSPGGEVSGLFDLVDFIYLSRNIKPIYSVANDHAFSAAYAIASATSRIFVNRTSGVGSVGVIATHVDVSEADKKDGIKFTTVFAGSKKNDLSPHEPISDEAVSDLQNEVDRLYEMFVETVSRNRNLSAEQVKATQAATYFAENSVAIGLADELISSEKMFEKIITFGGKMNELEKYKADVLEISKLCKLAHAENKIAKFIEEDLTPDQVKNALLEMQSQKESKEIISAIYQKETVHENPVLAAAKQRKRDA